MEYTGWNRILYVFLILLLTVETVRSLLHMLLADGGANSIAGINTSGTNGSNLIAIFGQWGTTQLVLAVLCWILFFYDDNFMTLIFGIIALEYILRIVEGWIKPLQSSTTPPGAILAYVIVPLSILAMIWSYYLHGKWI